MSITPEPPLKTCEGRLKHGSILNGNITLRRVSSQWKSTLFLSRANHPIHTASTFPIRSFGKKDDDLTSKGPIVIGNDVWIGQRAIIMSGVRIGDGSIIGAGSIVTKNVAPYAIVAGNPARFVRFRFDADIANRLAASKWWEWPDEVILRNVNDFDLPAEEFLSKHGF
jgi:acetyltransferase-like isoleucine patch superfamily enzyme